MKLHRASRFVFRIRIQKVEIKNQIRKELEPNHKNIKKECSILNSIAQLAVLKNKSQMFLFQGAIAMVLAIPQQNAQIREELQVATVQLGK